MNRRPNKLIGEKSPYLLQHAYNPVDWHPWGEEAFEKARREDKPVFLSIGYATCHWCHVMEKESFEDDEVAALMNETFVSIKVDREERTDLDHIYMTVCQMLTGSGGWPLTIILTPEKKPFFAATYVPKRARFGRMGLMDLIPRLREVWLRRRSEALVSAEKIVEALRGAEKTEVGGEADASLLSRAYEELAQRFDAERGGFSRAPKFPMPHNLSFILRFWKRTKRQESLRMVEKTLQAMRRGGIYDQVGFGFHRYSTDDEWLVPHFEKMLYDQALLAIAYLEAFQATGNHFYAETAQEVFSYLLRDMKAPEGGFYSAEDADSEGVEGKYYVWREGEIRDVLGDADAEAATILFGTSEEGNFHEEGTGEKTGANILRMKESVAELACRLNASPAEAQETLKRVKKKLFEARTRRPPPLKDDKVLTDWNGLTAASFARGAQILGDPRYLQAAKGIASFVFSRMTTPEGRLLHRYRAGEAGIAAHLDDYAFFVWGLIELYEACFEPFYLKAALDLNQDMLDHYWDDKEGGLFFVPDDGEEVLVRRKEIYDGAVPSGNSAAMLNLLRLGRLTGKPELEDKAFRIGRAFSSQVRQMPSGFTQFLAAVDFGIGPSYEIVVAGPSEARDTQEMLDAVRSRFFPNVVLLCRPPGGPGAEIDALAEFVGKCESLEGKATAYVCSGQSCKSPTTEAKQMLEALS